jgi:hypothetical protein
MAEAKQAGTDAFKKQDFAVAAMHYSTAMKEMPNEHTLFR